ncbi:protein translocase subunit secB [Sinobacterium caligoides]|uniref:Protein-export protein SecB n=1 Tax=Sinobacterium caligoides TaxID=933926 RepID=A0A3N2DGF7_9GAMM|nr:protein-export chaperone SecB [Sinobacterium caligoides]ROR98872.1 protein translocase subunit secB [Sinobacterium caligoides]
MAEENAAAGPEGQQFALQRIFIKDLSFEAPQGAAAFKQQWRPQVNLDLNTRNSKLDDDNYEVVLTLTVTAKQDDETAFLIEVQQGGIFLCKGLEGEQLHQVLGSLCPSILFPYARETIDSLVVKGSFPPLMIAPVNFEALYQQALVQQDQKPN